MDVLYTCGLTQFGNCSPFNPAIKFCVGMRLLTTDSQFRECRGKPPFRPVKIIIGHFILQAIFPVHPISIVIVHPVKHHIVNFSREDFRETFGNNKDYFRQPADDVTGKVSVVEWSFLSGE